MSPTDSILVNVLLLLLLLFCFGFFVNYSEDINPFVRLLLPWFWTSGDVYLGFKASVDPLTCVFCHMYVMGYRFTYGATPADLLVVIYYGRSEIYVTVWRTATLTDWVIEASQRS